MAARNSGFQAPRPVAPGFSLIELMVVVGIVAILSAIALPSYRQSIQNNRTATEANAFATALNITRGEATSRSRPISFCPSADGASCTNSTNWTANKWIAFTDYGVKGTVDGTDTVLRVWDAIDTQDSLISAPVVKWVSFDRAGNATTDNALITISAQFILKPLVCVPNAPVMRTITLALLGRVSTISANCP